MWTSSDSKPQTWTEGQKMRHCSNKGSSEQQLQSPARCWCPPKQLLVFLRLQFSPGTADKSNFIPALPFSGGTQSSAWSQEQGELQEQPQPTGRHRRKSSGSHCRVGTTSHSNKCSELTEPGQKTWGNNQQRVQLSGACTAKISSQKLLD